MMSAEWMKKKEDSIHQDKYNFNDGDMVNTRQVYKMLCQFIAYTKYY